MKMSDIGLFAVVLFFLNLGLLIMNIVNGNASLIPINALAMGFCAMSIISSLKK